MDKFINSIMDNLPVIILIIPLYLLVQKTSNSFRSFVQMYSKAETIRKANVTVPNEMKISACERLTLFIERITPESLITRLNDKNINNRDFQIILLKEIRSEYEYNLTQQLYVNDITWQACENAKNEIISMINTASSKTNPEGHSIELSNNILQLFISNKTSINTAKSLLKRELV